MGALHHRALYALPQRALVSRCERRAAWLYTAASLAFALTFMATRVVGYGLGIFDLWRNYQIWRPAQWGLYWVIGGVHLGYALNLFWSVSVLKAMARALGKKKGA